MASFDFITDEDFRTSLEKDFQEMNLCIQAGSYKAAVVIAGSIIETVLIDYVIAENIIAREDALKLDFFKVLTLCKDKKIISEKTSDLSSVIKGYRNLIHPGRAIRLNEVVDKNSAEVSRALVNIVLGEVEKRKKENYGYTAEQIVSKLENDPSATSIIYHLLDKVNDIEIERLLMKVLPTHYLYNEQNLDYSNLVEEALTTCFRIAFVRSGETTKKKVVSWLVKIFSEENNQVISSYGIAFLRASDLEYVSKEEASLVKQYLLGRIRDGLNEKILEATDGIGNFLENADTRDYVNQLITGIFQSQDRKIAQSSRMRLTSTVYPEKIKSLILMHIDRWINLYNEKSQLEKVKTLEGIKESLLEEYPF